MGVLPGSLYRRVTHVTIVADCDLEHIAGLL